MRFASLATCLLVAVTAAAQAPFLPSAPSLDVVRYAVELVVPSLGRDAVRGNVRVEFKALQRLDEVRLNVEPARITIDAVRDGNGNAPLVFRLVPGLPNAHGLTGTTLGVTLPASLFAGDAGVIDIEYRASVQTASDQHGFFYHPNHNGSRIVTTRTWPYYARYWLPSNDHPSDAAQFRFVLDVPAGVAAVANGLLTGTSTADGRAVHVWEQSQPIPTYLAQITVGELTSVMVPLEFLIPERLPDRAQYEAQIARAADALQYFSAAFGPYPFSKLVYMAAPHPFSMESASLINLVNPGSAVHELVHHWWGNAVQIRTWGDFWISEGLTTYFTGFFDELRTGVNTSCMTTTRKLNVASDQDPLDLFNADPYCVGAAVVHDYRVWLAGALGRDVRDPEAIRIFLAVFRRVYEDLAFQSTDTRGLMRVLAGATDAETDLSAVVIGAAIRDLEGRWFNGLPPPEGRGRRRAVAPPSAGAVQLHDPLRDVGLGGRLLSVIERPAMQP